MRGSQDKFCLGNEGEVGGVLNRFELAVAKQDYARNQTVLSWFLLCKKTGQLERDPVGKTKGDWPNYIPRNKIQNAMRQTQSTEHAWVKISMSLWIRQCSMACKA